MTAIDPVCGMPVADRDAIVVRLDGKELASAPSSAASSSSATPPPTRRGCHRRPLRCRGPSSASPTSRWRSRSPLARMLVAGCDLWLNTPLRPLEASGTSGMKAAHNGVPSLSVLDGWWREGHIEGVTGWSIGGPDPVPQDRAYADDAADLYRKLDLILPMFYDRRDAWIAIMRQCIALNASYFNSHRMVQQYLLHAYAVDAARARASA